MSKKAVGTLIAVVALALLSMGTAFAQDKDRACNDDLIYGDYGFTIEGAKLLPPPMANLPQVGVALAHFDGYGKFQQIDSVTINGTQVADFTHTPAKGTYTVNSNCTGTFTLNFTDGRPPVVTDFVVVGNGDEIDAVVVSVGGMQGLLATRSTGKRVSGRR